MLYLEADAIHNQQAMPLQATKKVAPVVQPPNDPRKSWKGKELTLGEGGQHIAVLDFLVI